MKNELQKCPPGKLVCTRNGDYFKWFQSDGTNLSYIRKSNKCTAEDLAKKRYLLALLEDLLHEKDLIDTFLSNSSSYKKKVDLLFQKCPEYETLLQTYFIPVNQELAAWCQEPYNHNPKYPEHLIHKSISGNLLRSKSEVIIDMTLYMNKIPYRYECELIIDNKVFYPDFTIRHPRTGKIYYWEHLGMMDNSTYSTSSYNKLKIFNAHGITQADNLITTFETNDHPLDANWVEKIIKYNFLN